MIMLTDKCQAIIDEAITAGGDLTKLSADAVAHIETCLDCRKSLDSIKALKASAVSVIPFAAAPALKSKIASKLESSMMARKAMSSGGATAKTILGISSVVIGLGLCGVITCGVIGLTNKNEMAYNPKTNNPPVVASSPSSPSASESVDLNKNTEDANNNSNTSNDEENIVNNDNLKSEPSDIEYSEIGIPSVSEDNEDETIKSSSNNSENEK